VAQLQLGRGAVEIEVQDFGIAPEFGDDVVGCRLPLVVTDLVLAGDDLHGARRSDDALGADSLVDGPLEDEGVCVGVERLHRQRADTLLEEGVHLVDMLGGVVPRRRGDVVDPTFRGRLLHASSESQKEF
jgi:hypothetical protein